MRTVVSAGESDESLTPTRDDLAHLPALHAILSALNDHAAGVGQLVEPCEELPVLGARLIAAARRQAPTRAVDTVARAMTLLGNRGFEAVLLQYLEDLTILKADLDEADALRRAG